MRTHSVIFDDDNTCTIRVHDKGDVAKITFCERSHEAAHENAAAIETMRAMPGHVRTHPDVAKAGSKLIGRDEQHAVAAMEAIRDLANETIANMKSTDTPAF